VYPYQETVKSPANIRSKVNYKDQGIISCHFKWKLNFLFTVFDYILLRKIVHTSKYNYKMTVTFELVFDPQPYLSFAPPPLSVLGWVGLVEICWFGSRWEQNASGDVQCSKYVNDNERIRYRLTEIKNLSCVFFTSNLNLIFTYHHSLPSHHLFGWNFKTQNKGPFKWSERGYRKNKRTV